MAWTGVGKIINAESETKVLPTDPAIVNHRSPVTYAATMLANFHTLPDSGTHR